MGLNLLVEAGRALPEAPRFETFLIGLSTRLNCDYTIRVTGFL
jgi:hypothetical protein